MPAEWTEEQIKKRRSHTHGPGPNDEPPDEEEEARTKAEKAAQNERELEESKRMEREQWEARERELEASWTKRVRTKGTGQQCYAGAFVRLHLTGRAKLDQSFVSQRALETGFKDNSIFEDSRERGVPNMLLVGRGILVPGLEKALLSMCAGEHAEVTIQPEGGYGTAGSISNPVVPGSATLTYDVEILTVEKEEELWELSFETKVELADERRRRGNTLVGTRFYMEANEEYEQGMRYLIFNPHPTEEQAAVLQPAMLTLHLNLAAVKLRLKREDDAIKQAHDALKISADHPKALYRIGQAYTQLGKYTLARFHLEKAEAVVSAGHPSVPKGDDSSLRAIREEMDRLSKRMERHERDRKKVGARMGLGSGQELDDSRLARAKRALGLERLSQLTAKSLGLTEGWMWGIGLLVTSVALAMAAIDARRRAADAQTLDALELAGVEPPGTLQGS